MNEKKSEKLAQMLMQADDDILEEAAQIDSAKDFQNLAKGKQKKPVRKKSRKWRFLVPIAAVLAVALVFLAVLPAFFREKEPAVYPWEKTTSSFTGSIHSLSEFLYFSAIRILQETNHKNTLCLPELPVPSLRTLALRPALLVDGKTDVAYENAEKDKYVKEFEEKEKNAPETNEDSNIYMCDLEPDTVVHIQKVWFFRIELSNPKSFLASKVGTGVIDVVITENDTFEEMITFRNGPYFYSFLLNGGSATSMIFSTHKYVEGFHICKNFAQENASFEVFFNKKEKVTGIRETSGVSFSAGHVAEEEMPLVGDSYTVSCDRSFTIADLGKYEPNSSAIPNVYYSTLDPLPEGNQPPIQIRNYWNDAYVLELHSDFTFLYYPYYGAMLFIESTHPIYQQGEYTEDETGIQLRFLSDGTIVKAAEGHFLENGNLQLDGDEYQLYTEGEK